MINVTSDISISEDELQFDFIRASGPGGQHVNKVASAAQLRFNVQASDNLPEDVKDRILKAEKNRINQEGEIIILAKRFRSQEKNRQDAIDRLIHIIHTATLIPKKRKKTKPSKKAKEKRLDEKRKISQKKQNRKRIDHD